MAEIRETESAPTDAEFVSIVETAFLTGAAIDRNVLPRLLRLAERGAKVPDEPTVVMLKAGQAATDARLGWLETRDAYFAMLTTTLTKDTDNG